MFILWKSKKDLLLRKFLEDLFTGGGSPLFVYRNFKWKLLKKSKE